ncbi:hypothetical protein DFH06DRAFT_1384922 [Mycena polygramma]|nr:hypothetical protein DFH06DRAFT_1384922 [Mycena polygramma]
MSATHDVPTTQIPTAPPVEAEIPPTPGVPGWFPDEPQIRAKQEEGGKEGGQEGGQEGGGLVETAKSYLPGEDDGPFDILIAVFRPLTNAGQAAKGWLPTRVAAYFPSSEEPSTSTSDPSVASEANTTSALSTLAEADSLGSTASSTTTPSTQSQSRPTSDSDDISTTVRTTGSDSPHPIAPLALGASESRFIEALPSPPISIPMTELGLRNKLGGNGGRQPCQKSVM